AVLILLAGVGEAEVFLGGDERSARAGEIRIGWWWLGGLLGRRRGGDQRESQEREKDREHGPVHGRGGEHGAPRLSPFPRVPRVSGAPRCRSSISSSSIRRRQPSADSRTPRCSRGPWRTAGVRCGYRDSPAACSRWDDTTSLRRAEKGRRCIGGCRAAGH